MCQRHPLCRRRPTRAPDPRDDLRAVSRRGIRAVGVDEIIETAGVAKATLYRHFPPKDDLVLAFLQRRDDVWTHGWVEREARSRADDSENQLLAIFDIFDEWFHSEDFE